MKTWQQLKNNPSLWPRYFVREVVQRAVRQFFVEKNFHEVETPLILAHPPAESYVDVFETTLLDRQRKGRSVYLATSPETSLKKLLVAGIGDCFAITKSFRNMETQSNLHNPEFTILEWYRVGTDYQTIMDDCEELILALYGALNTQGRGEENKLTYQGAVVDLARPWERLTVAQAFARYGKMDLGAHLTLPAIREAATKKGYRVEPSSTWEELYNQIFLNEVEPKLGRGKPTILYEFPAAVAALARRKGSDPRWAERFEFYIGGLELGDAYSELTDWKEQQERFEREITEIKRLGKTVYDYDSDFIEALKVGLPQCSGIAVGLDRLVMLFADAKNIQDVLFFPVAEIA